MTSEKQMTKASHCLVHVYLAMTNMAENTVTAAETGGLFAIELIRFSSPFCQSVKDRFPWNEKVSTVFEIFRVGEVPKEILEFLLIGM